MLFKKFGLVDSFDIELAETDPDKLIDMVATAYMAALSVLVVGSHVARGCVDD